ncbi:hypothetical protein [Latilactobacillus sakei]|uniref:Uncharacterized protein n=1 Tax=Latilactobacillus sakei TaxID=1599 RepID=A0AAX0V9F1_LATSK|nr:hypothetical protein [Latilactobacillus sakei]ASN12755.1 hypothetical protein B4V05_05865 [Latilactobacillus sakei]MCM1597273.1 hypothetical protein [Latilactobacillus sakei]MCM1635128.1 hypothetical protein [Latilactobacillus sakei]PKX60420.1 hypothetical protein CUR39_09730 [Latilactobacillus sakei]PKX70513.1 hypothetical protein CUR36_02765 [Latilactobacillus sakei]
MQYVSLQGTISSTIRVISFDPYLVRFTLQTSTQDYNCLVAKDAFNLMYVAIQNAPIAVFGHYNRRKQLIIDKYHVRNVVSG